MGSERLRHRVALAVSAVLLCTVLPLSCGRGGIELPEPEIIEGAEMRFSPGTNRASLIDWEPWGEQAFMRAARERKPVILVLTALGPPAARRYDEVALSDSSVIERLNREFVPVRVDVERHPEVSRRFQDRHPPSTICLSPEGEVVDAGGYLDVRSLEAFLTNCLERHSGEGEVRRQPASRERPASRDLSGDLVDVIVTSIRESFGSSGSGLQEERMVPRSGPISLLLYRAHARDDEVLARLASDALLSVQDHGAWDRIEGGVYDARGKRLEANADFALSCLDAWEATGNQSHRRAARQVLDYVTRVLYDDTLHLFRAGQLGDDTYFELGRGERAAFYAPPQVDGTLYTDRNARAASAALRAGIALEEEWWTERALAALDRLWAHAVGDDGLVFHVCAVDEKAPAAPGLVADAMYLARGMLDAYAYTGVPDYLSRARTLVDQSLLHLWDEGNGAFLEHPSAAWLGAAPGADEPPFEGNSVGALVLLRLSWCTEQVQYRDAARRILERLSGEWDRQPDGAGAYGLALQRYLHYPVRMMIIGSPEEAQTRALLRESLRLYEPGKHVQLLDPEKEPEEVEARGFPTDMDPAIFVCVGRACSAPILDAEEVAGSVSSFVEQMGRK